MGQKKERRKSDKGFTLVELIVVLVILAILAGVLTPALLGHIDTAKAKKLLVNARTCMDAAQAEFTRQYAANGGTVAEGRPVVGNARLESTSGNFDQDITNTEFAQRILDTAGMTGDDRPYCFMVAVGSNATKGGLNYEVTQRDKYTVYYAFYMEKEDSAPWYYYNGDWTRSNPRATGTNSSTEIFDGNNIVKKGALTGKRLQYYLISNKTRYTNSIKDGNFWNWLKSMK